MFNRYLMVDLEKQVIKNYTIVSISIFYINTQTIGKIRPQGYKVQNTDFRLFGQNYAPPEFVSTTPRSKKVYFVLWVRSPSGSSSV
jgi:hypothetical protein